MTDDEDDTARRRSRRNRPMSRTVAVVLIAAVGGAGLYMLGDWIYRQAVAKRVQAYDAVAREYAREFHLPAELVEAVIWAESRGRADAESPAGAKGLMQVTDVTEREVTSRRWAKVHKSVWVKRNPCRPADGMDLFDPEYNIYMGTAYLRMMIDRFDGDVTLALAAYNMGPTKLRKLLDDHPGQAGLQVVERYSPRETQRYVQSIFEHLGGRFRRLPAEDDSDSSTSSSASSTSAATTRR